MPNIEDLEYVWAHPLSKGEISGRFKTPEEAGEWLRSSEGVETARKMLFPPTLRAVNEGNFVRPAHPHEWRRARGQSQPAVS